MVVAGLLKQFGGQLAINSKEHNWWPVHFAGQSNSRPGKPRNRHIVGA